MKILVVDDEKLLVKGIKFNLENDGYEVVTGCDGMEAVELAASETPDLIVLDLMMPRLDGLEACTKNSGVFAGPHHHADRQVRGYGQAAGL